MERLVMMFVALLASFVLAWMPFPPLGDLSAGLRRIGARLNRPIRSETDRAIRGVFMTLVVAAIGFFFGRIVGSFVEGFGEIGRLAGIFGLALVMAAPARHALFRRYMGATLLHQPLRAGRMAAALAGQEAVPADVHAAARLVVAEVARDVERRLITPLFWFLLGGFPMLFLVWAVALLDRAVGHNLPGWRPFGGTASNLDFALRWIPARLSVAFLAFAAVFTDGGQPRKSFMTALMDARQHPSRLGGWPVAAMAGALGIMLGAPRVGGGGWMGSGTARIGLKEVRRAMRINAIVRLILAAVCAGAALLA